MHAFDAQVKGVTNSGAVEVQPVDDEGAPNARWLQLRRDAAKLRPELHARLADLTGCFQGDRGSIAFALDSTLFEFTNDEDDVETALLTAQQREHVVLLKSNRLRPAVRPLAEQLQLAARTLETLLGAEPDKQTFLATLPDLFGALVTTGDWPEGFDRSALRREMEAFRNCDFMAQLHEARPLIDAGTELDLTADQTLDRLGRLDMSAIEQATQFLTSVNAFVTAAERAISAKDGALSGVDPTADAAALAEALEQADQQLGAIMGTPNQ